METIVILSHVVFDNSPYCSFVHEHAKALKCAGYNVIVFAILNWFPGITMLRKDRKKQYKEKKGAKIIDGVTVIYKKALSFSNFLDDSKINLNGISYYFAINKKIRKIAKENKILFIDAHTLKVEGYVAALLHKKLGLKATVTCHGTSMVRTSKYKNAEYIISNIANNVNNIICVSNFLANKLKRFNIKNVKIIYNGINFYNLQNKEVANCISILTVANLIKQKNIDLVIKSFNELQKYSEEICNLVIVGDGEKRNELEQLVKDLGIQKQVVFKGRKSNEEVYELMQSSDIFVLPSVEEGFGIVYVEAMYNGCITIGTIGEGIDGFIENEKNGFLVNPNVEDIVKTIKYILNNKEKMKKIKLCAIEDAKKMSWNANVEKYIELFKER